MSSVVRFVPAPEETVLDAAIAAAVRFNAGADALELPRSDRQVAAVAAALREVGCDFGNPDLDGLLRGLTSFVSKPTASVGQYIIWAAVGGEPYNSEAIKLPFYVDMTRFVFYRYTSFVSEMVVVQVFYMTMSVAARRVDSCQVRSITAYTKKDGASFWCIPSFYQSYGAMPLRSVWTKSRTSPNMKPFYNNWHLGHVAGSVAYNIISYGGKNFNVTSKGNDAVVSPACRLTPAMTEALNTRSETIGRTGMLAGLVPPLDDDGRLAVVLPVERLALPCKELPRSTVIEQLDKLTRAVAGGPPMWMTPAGRFTTEECL